MGSDLLTPYSNEELLSHINAKRCWVLIFGATMKRDLRLNFFRGLSLWMILLDHIPSHQVNDIASWLTIRNYGLSDAAEIFVFISGYTASLVYGRKMLQRGFLVGAAQILRRTWQIHVAHLFLFACYVAEVGYASLKFDAPNFENYTNTCVFFHHPETALVKASLLSFKPVDLDVLPVYILLLAGFPPVLWLLRRAPQLVLAGSASLYGCVWLFGWNLSAYPDGLWYFNPFAWQILFVLGAWCAAGGIEGLKDVIESRSADRLSMMQSCLCCSLTTWGHHTTPACYMTGC